MRMQETAGKKKDISMSYMRRLGDEVQYKGVRD